jgi:hypothetical protein
MSTNSPLLKFTVSAQKRGRYTNDRTIGSETPALVIRWYTVPVLYMNYTEAVQYLLYAYLCMEHGYMESCVYTVCVTFYNMEN